MKSRLGFTVLAIALVLGGIAVLSPKASAQDAASDASKRSRYIPRLRSR